MADQPRRARNRPDSRAMWDESDRRSHHGGARDRRDNRDRYRDEPARGYDRRQRSRSRSPIGERRDREDRDRDYDRDRRRGHENPRDKMDGRRHERERGPDREKDRERDGRRREDYHEERAIPKGPSRRGDPRRSISPQRSPLKKGGRAAHDAYSPLPTRSKYPDKDSDHSSARDAPEDENPNRTSKSKNKSQKKKNTRDAAGDEEERGRAKNRESDGEDGAMDVDDNLEVEDNELSAMQAMMGFGGFGTTKGQKVAGNNAGAVYKAKKTEYRQYMNRIGGFNRPLSPGR